MAVSSTVTIPTLFTFQQPAVTNYATLCSPDSPTRKGSYRLGSNAVVRTRRRAKCLFSRFFSPKFVCSCIPACAVLAALTFTLFIGKDYVKYGLLWLDNQEEWIVCIVFLILYTAVSFPMTWGYVLLNLACGYHFGLIAGTVVTAIAASAGIVFAHLLMKHYFVGTITAKLLGPDVLKATIAALQSAHAFKLIAISRLTPIPFGLQNALFAISPVCLWRYVGASALGLFPTQLISVYLGTTVRSMEEVLVDENTATVGYGVLILQVVLSVALLAYILKRARQELSKSVKGDLEEIIVGSKKPTNQTWNNWKSTVRSQYIKIKQHARGTGGGGPAINRLSIEDEKLMSMIGAIRTEGNPEIKEIGFQTENVDETSRMEERINTGSFQSTPMEEVIVECVIPEEKSFVESVATPNFHDYIEISQSCETTGASPNTPITSSVPRQAFLNRQNRNRRRRELPIERAAKNFSEFQKMQAEATSELTEAIQAQTKAIKNMTCVLEKIAAKLT